MTISPSLRACALTKLAYYGPACVNGVPPYTVPQQTVGQTMYDIGSSLVSGMERRRILNKIVDTNIDVNSPAKRLLHAGIGSLAGNFISTRLNSGPFTRGVMTALGAAYGYNR